MSSQASEKNLPEHSFYELQHTKLRSTLEQLFHTLDEAALTMLIAKLQWLEVRGGDVLFRQGEVGDSLYLLISGRMKAVLETDTTEERMAGEISQGECVGEMSLITGERRAATVYAIRDCLLTRLSQEDFKQLLSEYPEVGISLSRLIINRLKYTMKHSKAPAKTFNIALVPASPGIPLHAFASQLVEAIQELGRVQFISQDHLPLALRPTVDFTKETDFALHHWLTEQEMEFDYLIYLADDTHSPWTQKCLRQADKILVLADATGAVSLSKLEKEVIFNSKRKYSQTRELIVLYPEHTRMPDRTHEVMTQREVTRHYNIRLNDAAHMQRLARMILDKGVGLVLSGGGAKGFAHLGIFKALKEAGVPVDMVCGTSMGSIIAAAIAHEWEADEMLQMGKNAFVIDKPLSDYTLPIISLLKGHKLQKTNKKYFGELHIENLWLNFFCVSGNYSTAEMVVIDKGPVWKAVTASVAIPGILPPVVEGNSLLIDGGIFNNFPVDIMKARYGGKLIGVDLLADKRYKLNYTELPGGWTLFISSLFPFSKRYKVPSIASIIIKSTLMSSMVHQRSQTAELEVAFSPPVADFGLLDLKSYDKIVDAGYQYAKDFLQAVDVETRLLQTRKTEMQR